MSEEGNGRKALLVVGIAVVERGRGAVRCGAQLPSAVARAVLFYFLHSLLQQRFQDPTKFRAMEEEESQMKRS